MFKHKVITYILLTAVLAPSGAYCQERVENQQMRTISGTITKIDTVGNIINVQTDTGEMAFSVSDHARIVRNTHDAGLLDIKEGDPVTIQYTSASLGKNSILRLVDNKPGNE